MAAPFDYNAAQQEAFEALALMGACIGEYDKLSIHVEMTPAFGHSPIGDSELPRIVNYINQIGNVRNLDLGETAITDVSASDLGQLKNVTWLCLSGTSISDRTLPFLRTIVGLKELVLSGTAITDGAVAELAQMRELTFLQLFETGMSDSAIASLKGILPGVVEA
jgi:internalin A